MRQRLMIAAMVCFICAEMIALAAGRPYPAALFGFFVSWYALFRTIDDAVQKDLV